MLECLQMGTQSVALLPIMPISVFASTLQPLDLPFLFPNRELAYKVIDGCIGSELLATRDEKSAKGGSSYEDGFNHFSSAKPINSHRFQRPRVCTMESHIVMEPF